MEIDVSNTYGSFIGTYKRIRTFTVNGQQFFEDYFNHVKFFEIELNKQTFTEMYFSLRSMPSPRFQMH